jgi:membrane protease YdiL (CAAX protease family)
MASATSLNGNAAVLRSQKGQGRGTAMTLATWRGFLLAVGVEGALALVAWGLGYLFDLPLWDQIRWDGPAIAWGIAASLPMLVAFLACVRWPVGPLRSIQQVSEEVIRPLFVSCSIWQLALLSVVAGIGEETLFRGILQGLLSRPWGPIPGLLLSSLLFGLLHPLTPTYLVLAALVGVYLGCWWLATDNLLVVIIAHALYDFVALIYLVTSGVRLPHGE